MMINSSLPIPIAYFEQDSAAPGNNRSEEQTSDFASVFLLIFAAPQEAMVGEPSQFKNVIDVGSGSDSSTLVAKQEPRVENGESQPLPRLLTVTFEGQDRQDFARTTNPLLSISESSVPSYSDVRESGVFVPMEPSDPTGQASSVSIPVESRDPTGQLASGFARVESSDQNPQGFAVFADGNVPKSNPQQSPVSALPKSPTFTMEDNKGAGRYEPIQSPAGLTSTSSLSKMVEVPNAGSLGSLAAEPEQGDAVALKATAQEIEMAQVASGLDRKTEGTIQYHSRIDRDPSVDPGQSRPSMTNKETGVQGIHSTSPAQESSGLFEDLAREHSSLGRRGGENRENFDRSQDPLAALRDVTFRQEVTRAQADTRPAPWASVIERVSGEIVSQLRQNRHEALIRLEPPELGHLKIELVVEGDKIQARISAEAMEARSLIQNHLPELRQALQAYKLELLEVRIDSGTWSGPGGDLPQGQQQGASGNETWGKKLSGSTGSSLDQDEIRGVDAPQLAQGRVSIRA